MLQHVHLPLKFTDNQVNVRRDDRIRWGNVRQVIGVD